MCMCGAGGGGGGDEWNCAGVALKPMGMALSVSGNHFVRHTTLILLVSLLPSAFRGAGPRLRLRGTGGGGIGAAWGEMGCNAAGQVSSESLFEDRQRCTALRHLMEAS